MRDRTMDVLGGADRSPDEPAGEATPSLVAHMPEVLRWTGGEEALRRTHEQYVCRLGDRLGRAVRRLGAVDATRADLVVQDMRDASDEALVRVLTAPETSFRLLQPRAGTLVEIGDYLHRCFLAEAAREGHLLVSGGPTWTALGDGWGPTTGVPPLGGRVPVDFDSPWSSRPDLTDAGTRPTSAVPLESRGAALSRLADALRGVAVASERAAGVVLAFIKVLVPRRHADEGVFSSCSSHRFIGRTVLVNPHPAEVGEVRLAEALVHEAVHSVLYMQMMQHERWGFELRGAAEPALPSPWTGRMLPLSSYLHACFVWYALAHFWGLALQNGAFPARRVAPHLARALVGFRGESLVSRMGDGTRTRVLPVVLDAIDAMQSSLLDAMRGLVPAGEPSP